MTKNKVKIIAIILAVLLICSGLIYLATRNGIVAYTSEIRKTISQSVENFGQKSNYYCLNKGWDYEPGYYVRTGTYTLDPLVAYAVGYEKYERKLGKIDANDHTSTNLYNNANNDAVANIIWDVMGDGRPHSNEPYISEEVQQIIAQAEILQNVTASDISITSPSSMLIANADGEYGPFIIKYPNIDGKLVGIDLNVIVNENTVVAVKDLIKKDDGYYLTEAHGIQDGVQNTIILEYGYKKYSGVYYEYTKEREIAIDAKCSECGGTGIRTSLGIYDCRTGVVEKNEDIAWTDEIVHTAGCSKNSDIHEEGNAYPVYPYYQDIMQPVVNSQTLALKKQLRFWVGTPDFAINFNKINTEGENVVGAKFNINVKGGAVKGETTISTVTGGNVLRIQPDNGATAITVTLTELEAPEEYAILDNPIILQYNWNSITKQWDCATKDFTFPTGEKVTIQQNDTQYETGDNPVNYTVTAENKRKIIVNLLKTDNASNVLENIKFDIDVTGAKCDAQDITTDANGKAQIVIVPDSTEEVKLVLTEKDSKGYKKLDPIEITFTYIAGTWQTKINDEVKDQVSIEGSIAIFDLEVVNIPIIEELVLIKTNKSVPGEHLPNITFRIDLGENLKTSSGEQHITAKTDDEGQISLGMLEILDASKDIAIKIEEISTPDDGLDYGDLINKPVTITLKHNDANSCNSDNSLVIPKYDVDKNIIELEVQNEITMSLSGMVWEDGQTGIKPVKAPNGKKDSGELGIPGIIVNLMRNDGKIQKTTVTDSEGKYEFKNVPISKKEGSNYYVEFVYDGINYVATTPGHDSDATEKDRPTFNNKFATITKNTANGTTGTNTTLDYTYDSTGKATLQTTVGGVLKEEFKMKADTRSATSSTGKDIDLGLVKKSVDLAAVTDIYSALVTINGESKTYNYNDIASLDKDEHGNPILENLEGEAQYNLYLYNSDYNYRIGDYQLPAARRESLTVYEKGATGELQEQRQHDGELNVELTYQVLLSNQSASDATVNQIAYYYDSRYELKGISIDTGTISIAEIVENAATTGSASYDKAIINVNADLTDADSQRVVNLTFDVGKDGSGNVYTGIMQNLVEIVSYSTNSGCIDKDSAPDNIEVNNNEDDTDDAAGLNVKLNNIERQVSGFVFEDEKTNNPGEYNIGDGVYDASNSNEKKIDDVIVQLIEIKDVTIGGTAFRLEYIWQETISGSDTVRYVTMDGLSQGTYTVSNEAGQYTFNQNIIPGDYIVRFIYGDGTYYDSTSSSNLLKYNGQDYKSTQDPEYDREQHWETLYSPNSSMARDNEARRIEEMAYARSVSDVSDLIINKNEGTDDEKRNKLNATWMCADTSLIMMKISDATTEGDTNSIVKNINFGLVERPKLSLSLEKHITGLDIDGAGIHVTARLDKYQQAPANGLVIDTEGSKILATATNKEQNKYGWWTVDLDADKIDGQQIKITYSYVVKNDGDLDYIGTALANAESYSKAAADVKEKSSDLNSNYIIGTYLGESYYNYQEDVTTNEVASKISVQVEDYISSTNGLTVDSTDWEVSDTTEPKNIWRYDSTNTAVEDSEDVYVLKSKTSYPLSTNDQVILRLPVTGRINSSGSSNQLQYRSYAAQLIYPLSGEITSTSGIICNSENTLGNLGTLKSDGKYHGAIKSYVEASAVEIYEIVPEPDEFIGEHVQITINTGGDKATPIFLIITITSGLAVVAVGIVLIKKFVIK